jgi:hypothetical protein
MKEVTVAIMGVLLLVVPFNSQGITSDTVIDSPPAFSLSQSIRNQIADAVVVSESDPFYSVVSTSVACWYNKTANTTGLLPLLVQFNGSLSDAQTRFLSSYLPTAGSTVLVLGDHLDMPYPTREILGSPADVAITLATEVFSTAPTVLIIPYGATEAYELGLLAAPLASYLNLPILVYDDNVEALQTTCLQLQTTHVFLVGNLTLSFSNVTVTSLADAEEITDAVLTVIAEQFDSLNYLTVTNPSDSVPPTVINQTNLTISDHVTNKKLIVLSKEIDVLGNDTREYTISIPEGITRVQISAEIHQKKTSLFDRLFQIEPLLFLTLTNPFGHVVAYANSMGFDFGKSYLETLTCNASGSYPLQVKVYQGMKGGFFIQRGFSRIDADITIDVVISTLASPHLPTIPDLSSIAPYLTAAHGGLLCAKSSWELTDAMYTNAAQGYGAGPWYTEALHPFTNMKVNITVQDLKGTLNALDRHGLLSEYLDGPAWLAILADTTMVPMYYYGPSQGDLPERGLPSDNPYSLQGNLSVGRVIGWDVQDVSVLIARTLFYEQMCGQPETPDQWHDRFSFVFGEGYSETGGIFHQIPYAKEIRAYGFTSTVYGDLRNSRQIAEFLDVYTGANYIEYLGHGDWFWFPASLYGFDMYSKAIDVAHAKDWVYDRPSIFLSSACLMGRTDGLPPQMNIGLAMLHAGCNGFVGATRETGQESGLTVLENHLIVDDWSVGEALRGEKQIDTEIPTFYVRVLYGDPAFNPYEPLHGFSDQGRPVMIRTD